MKKKMSSTHCSFCHLALLVPHKKVKKTLFLGVLKKGVKRHEISFSMGVEDVGLRYRVQVRCFRLK